MSYLILRTKSPSVCPFSDLYGHMYPFEVQVRRENPYVGYFYLGIPAEITFLEAWTFLIDL